MSTRCTIKIGSTAHTPSVTLYQHHDGYPSNMEPILNTVMERAQDISVMPSLYQTALLKELLVALPKAYVTEGHSTHGDTEYQYTFNGAPGSLTTEKV